MKDLLREAEETFDKRFVTKHEGYTSTTFIEGAPTFKSFLKEWLERAYEEGRNAAVAEMKELRDKREAHLFDDIVEMYEKGERGDWAVRGKWTVDK